MQKKLYPLTHAEEGIVYLYNISPMKCMLNIPTSAFFEGEVDEDCFKRALRTACERCDSLDIRLYKDGDKILQYFEHSEPVIDEWDFSAKKNGDAMEKAIKKDTQRDMLAYDKPLYSLAIIKSHDGMIGAYFNVFHIIMDNIAICMLWTDFMNVYTALKDGKPLPEAPASYEANLPNDYAYYNSPRYIADREYWSEFYKTMPEPTFTNLAGKQYLEAIRKKEKNSDLKSAYTICLNSKSRHDIHVLPAEKLELITKYCEESKVSLNAVFETGMAAYLAHINEVDSIYVPAVASCRATKAERTCGGTRVNMSFVKIDIDRAKNFTENCQSFMLNYIKELRYGKFPYLENLAMMKEAYKTPPLYNYYGFFISFQPYRFPTPEGVKLHTMWHCIGNSLTCVYVTVMDDDGSGGLRFYYDLPEAHGSKDFIKNAFDSMIGLIMEGITNPERPIGEDMAKIKSVRDENFRLPILVKL